MRKLTIALAAGAALLAGPALAGPVSGKAPVTVNPITEAQVSIQFGPNHSRSDSRRHSRRESRGDHPRCKTISEHRSGTSRTKTITRCFD
jgi:hypothetical protein